MARVKVGLALHQCRLVTLLWPDISSKRRCKQLAGADHEHAVALASAMPNHVRASALEEYVPCSYHREMKYAEMHWLAAHGDMAINACR